MVVVEVAPVAGGMLSVEGQLRWDMTIAVADIHSSAASGLDIDLSLNIDCNLQLQSPHNKTVGKLVGLVFVRMRLGKERY